MNPEISEQRIQELIEASRRMTPEHLSMMMAHITHDHFLDEIAAAFALMADALEQEAS